MNYRTRQNKAIKIVWLILAVFWMYLIFHFSDQKAAVSSQLSGTFTYRMSETVSDMFHLNWQKDTLLSYVEILEHPVRKAAHMTEYAILAAIFLGNFYQYSKTFRYKWYLAAGCAAVYAATDEIHQLFVQGRSGQVSDVCIDTVGAVLGLAFVYILICIYKKYIYKSE